MLAWMLKADSWNESLKMQKGKLKVQKLEKAEMQRKLKLNDLRKVWGLPVAHLIRLVDEPGFLLLTTYTKHF